MGAKSQFKIESDEDARAREALVRERYYLKNKEKLKAKRLAKKSLKGK